MRSAIDLEGGKPGDESCLRALSFQNSQLKAPYSHLIAHAIRGVTPYESVRISCGAVLDPFNNGSPMNLP